MQGKDYIMDKLKGLLTDMEGSKDMKEALGHITRVRDEALSEKTKYEALVRELKKVSRNYQGMISLQDVAHIFCSIGSEAAFLVCPTEEEAKMIVEAGVFEGKEIGIEGRKKVFSW